MSLKAGCIFSSGKRLAAQYVAAVERQYRCLPVISLRIHESVDTVKKCTAAIHEYTQICNGRIELHLDSISNAVSKISCEVSHLRRQLHEKTTAIEQKVDEKMTAIESQVGELTANVNTYQMRNCVLERLAYDGMGSWYERVGAEYNQTLEWLVDEAVKPCKETNLGVKRRATSSSIGSGRAKESFIS